ncbi:SDR family NAD(P)-dependent oxidoreductase [Saccharomonospora viridis]|jgi:3alpha(or 20beta)-hydroxysteroid dehydrogenase|uniref:SDR family NAD(P)-dependent oxidoreductase n=1 Tax=Saccharomonospora viridis TaxID=1852 RepID=UPI00240A1706|nr:SDR family oxidoreductase [Saccharomonospora viridis]
MLLYLRRVQFFNQGVHYGHDVRFSTSARSGQERLSGRVILVTGAAGGLGTSIVSRLAAEGARVVASDIDADTCASVIAELADRGGAHTSLPLDVRSDEDWQAAIEHIQNRYGVLHGCVNNAAIGGLASVADERRDRWDRIIAIGQTGVWLGMKYAGGLLERCGGGSIVNICSILGTVGGFGDSIAYHAAKGAVRAMTKNAALHWATQGIRVNSLHPGFIGTEQVLDLYAGSPRHESMLSHTPMGRLADPAEIAAVVAFLLSDDSSYMTGSEIYADGGWTAR